MPSLTSCYFCGDAVGASLDEYRLPADAPPDDQVAVTLCAGCVGKLSELLAELEPGVEGDGPSVAPVEGAAGSGVAQAPGDVGADAVDPDVASAPELDPVAGEREPIFADDGDAVLDEALPGEAGEDPPFGESEEPTDDANDRDRTADGAEAADAAGGEQSEAAADAPPEAPDAAEGPAEGTDDPVAAADDPAEAADTAGDDPMDEVSDAGEAPEAPAEATAEERSAEDTADADADTDPDAPGADTAGAAAASSTANTASGAGESTGDGPLAEVSPRTYNRVVRLLQNREFPVDRNDFEALATSAYELDHGECTAALDGAIAKGLLEEREGELRRPE